MPNSRNQLLEDLGAVGRREANAHFWTGSEFPSRDDEHRILMHVVITPVGEDPEPTFYDDPSNALVGLYDVTYDGVMHPADALAYAEQMRMADATADVPMGGTI